MRGRAVWIVVVAIAALAAISWLHCHRARSPSAGRASATAQLPAVRERDAAPRPASLTGRVTRAGDGAGVAGAIVAVGGRAGASGFTPPPLVATTTADGTWTASPVSPGQYDVTATADGYVPAHARDIAIAPGEQRTGVALALAPGGTLVHGTVNDFSGGPIAGALILIQPRAASDRLVAMTDRTGAYRLSLRPGRYDVTAWHDDYIESARQHIVVTDRPLTVDFRLVPGGAIHGRVVARDTKRPVAGATVSAAIQSNWGPLRAVLTALTGDDGTFVIAHCPSGLLEVSAYGRDFTSRAPSEVRLGVGEQVNGVEVLVDRGVSITGRVIDKATRAPLAGVMVTASGADAEQPTGSDGAFAIGGLAPGHYSVAGRAAGGLFVPGKDVEVSDKTVAGVELELDTGVALDGRVEPPGEAVVSIEVAEPIGDANIVTAVLLEPRAAAADATTGAWTLPHAPPGTWKLVARAPDGATGELPITVTQTAQHGLVIALAPRDSIAGRVVDSDGKPVPGIRVTAIPPGNPQSHSVVIVGDRGTTKSGDDGAFEITGLDAGAYHVVADDGDQMVDGSMAFVNRASITRGTPVELAPGAHVTGIVLTVRARTGVIHGSVVDATRQPVADVWVTATSVSDYSRNPEPALTNESGTFELTGLAPGAYNLVADGSKRPTHAAQNGVQTGATVTLQLAPLGTLSGHVLSGGAPAAPFEIFCSGPSGLVRTTVNAPDGAYAFDHLAPGKYECTAMSDSSEAIDRIDVPAGPIAHDFTLVAEGSLTGRVINPATDTPVENAEVRLEYNPDRSMRAGGVTDALGNFALSDVPAGSGVVMIIVGDRHVERPFSMPAGGQLDLGTLLLR